MNPGDLPVRIAPLEPARDPQAARLLARAFRDSPLNAAVVGGDADRRLRSGTHGMRALLPLARSHGQIAAAHRGANLAGVLVAAPPGGYPLPAPPLGVRARTLLGQGWRVSQRWARVFEALRAVHPVEPHWYLGALGVAPELQGCGVGHALLERWLVEIDRDGFAAYLETDRLATAEFYARRGFGIEGELEVLGARVWRMRRPGRAELPAPT